LDTKRFSSRFSRDFSALEQVARGYYQNMDRKKNEVGKINRKIKWKVLTNQALVDFSQKYS
jgi:hypothetical protein